MAAIAALLLSATLSAQSIDLSSPTPVVSNDLTGRILPLDIGDARSTRFFYTFNGLQGDLEMTVESNNLDGDIDVFLASNLRPLTKVTLYAGTSPTRVTKTVFLRREEPLILRVQARTPNDSEGTYRISFGGAFRPAARLAATDAASTEAVATASPSPTPTARGTGREVKRVSSVGARIAEPAAEVAAKDEPEKSEETAIAPPPETKKSPARTPPARTRTGGRRNSARTGTARGNAAKVEGEKPESVKADAAETSASSDGAETAAAGTPPATKPTRPVRVPRARNNRNTRTARNTTAAPADTAAATPGETAATPTAPAAPSPRLVLVMRDGERVERDMAGIRRVTVENGFIVIVPKAGKTERQSMSGVLRMSIEP